ncbi:MAG: glycoside hydrolase family 5 protein [Opitutaceae bacterium]|jgi:sugar phosphate isomerase/epimerase|nr:glycoside hydrolase family 5 protein [Opitutaceae bacterium]
MKHIPTLSPLLAAAAIIAAAITSTVAAAAAVGEVIVYQTNFDSLESLKNWNRPPGAKHETTGGIGDTGHILFANTKETDSNLATIPLDVEKLRGRAVMVEAYMKAEDISNPTRRYFGPKLMLGLTNEDGGKQHPDQEKITGTYDWRKFTVFARISPRIREATLCIGLQHSTGKLRIDSVKVTLVPLPTVPAGGLENQLPAQKKTKYRGVMSGGDLTPDAIRELAETWHANLIRFQGFTRRRDGDNTTEEGFRAIVARAERELDTLLPLARQYGIKIVIDMHCGPGTSLNALLSNQLSWEPGMQRFFAGIWREIAAKYKDEPAIYGYDLLNEPREGNYVYTPDGGLDWNRLAEKISRAIREVDPTTPIIIEGAPWGSAGALEFLQPINVPNIIYSFHIYSPHAYTHQGVGKDTPPGLPWPGTFDGKHWDKAALEKEVEPVVVFQKKYNVPVYVGEFGATRWAPGNEQYLDDLISIFEKHGWDWTYHAFREYHGWDAEMGSDKNDTTRIKDTPRRAVLLNYMKRNQR